MRSKKGSVLHWIVFGVLAAFGLFFVFTVSIDIQGLDGKWQLGFLEKYYLEAEKDLLKIDQTARFAGWQAALELAEKTGFAEQSECGVLEDYNVLNDAEGFCSEDIKGNLLAKVNKKLGETHSDFKLEGKELTGKGKKKTITTAYAPKSFLVKIPYVSYTYDASFRVNLGFDAEGEYKQLINEAIKLVGDCKKTDNLIKCIEEKRKAGWKSKDCDEKFVVSGRKVPFCVETGTKIYNEKGALALLRYKFALDFTEVE